MESFSLIIDGIIVAVWFLGFLTQAAFHILKSCPAPYLSSHLHPFSFWFRYFLNIPIAVVFSLFNVWLKGHLSRKHPFWLSHVPWVALILHILTKLTSSPRVDRIQSENQSCFHTIPRVSLVPRLAPGLQHVFCKCCCSDLGRNKQTSDLSKNEDYKQHYRLISCVWPWGRYTSSHTPQKQKIYSYRAYIPKIISFLSLDTRTWITETQPKPRQNTHVVSCITC